MRDTRVLDNGQAPLAPLVEPRLSLLHDQRPRPRLPTPQRLNAARDTRAIAGRKILLVDDDVRNIFALTSLLETHDAKVIYAENGRAGIDALHAHRDVELVLMDIMMPELDGYETMREIRLDPRYGKLPIIAVTGKVLRNERERCIAAGASDYLPKPVDTEALLAAVTMWLST